MTHPEPSPDSNTGRNQVPEGLPENPETTFGVTLEDAEFIKDKMEAALQSGFFDPQGHGPTDSDIAASDHMPSPLTYEVDSDYGVTLVGEASSSRNYRYLNKFAVGGFGEIWEAEQRSLHRTIAIKKIRSDKVKARLERCKSEWQRDMVRDQILFQIRQEALLCACLEHPNIMPVHDLAIDKDGTLLIIMKRVYGTPWSNMIRRDIQNLDYDDYLTRHLEIMIQTAQGVAFAHSRGIIHRDIKPSQVIVGEFGETLLMDFGLAISIDDSNYTDRWKAEKRPVPPSVTFATARAGTPYFMAPEQTRNDLNAIGPWTDVYLLGTTLYTILTGEWPRFGKDSKEVFLKAVQGEIISIDETAKDLPVPKELISLFEEATKPSYKDREITAKEFLFRLDSFAKGHGKKQDSVAMVDKLSKTEINSDQSYTLLSRQLNEIENAQKLWPANPKIDPLRDLILSAYTQRAIKAGDLKLAQAISGRLQDDERRENFSKEIDHRKAQIRKKEKVASFAIASTGLLFLAIIGSLVLLYNENQQVERQVRRAEDALNLARENEALATQSLATARKEQYFAAIGLAASALEEGNTNKALTILFETAPATERRWEWGALLSQVAAHDRSILIGEAQKGTAVFHSDISPNGRYLATGHGRGKVTIWDLYSLELIEEWNYPLRGIWSVDYSPDGNRLLLTSLEGLAYVIDATDGSKQLELSVEKEGTRNFMRGGEFSPDGASIATTARDGSVTLWSSRDGTKIWETTLSSITYDVAFSPTEDILVVSAIEGEFPHVLDLASGEVIDRLETTKESTLGVAISPDGKQVALASNDGIGYLYNFDTGEMKSIYESSTNKLRDTAFSDDGKYVAFVDGNGSLAVIDIAEETLALNKVGTKQTEKVTFHPTLPIVITTAFDAVMIYDLRRLLPRPVSNHTEPVDMSEVDFHLRVPSFPRDDGIIWDRYDDFWLNNEGRHVYTVSEVKGVVDSFYTAYSPDGRYYVKMDEIKSNAVVYKTGSDAPIEEIAEEGIFFGAFTPDGELLILTTYQGTLRLFDTDSWEQVAEEPALEKPPGVIWNMDFHPTKNQVALGWSSGDVSTYDLDMMKARWVHFNAHDPQKPVPSIRYSANGDLLVSASSDETAKVWNAADGSLVSTLKGHTLNVLSASFSSDASRVATTSMDDTVRLWETETGREIATLFTANSEDALMAVTFSKDGKSLYLATRRGVIHRMETFPWEEDTYGCDDFDDYKACLERWKAVQRTLDFSPQREDNNGRVPSSDD